METKIINNRYELIACTAVATEAGDTEVLPLGNGNGIDSISLILEKGKGEIGC